MLISVVSTSFCPKKILAGEKFMNLFSSKLASGVFKFSGKEFSASLFRLISPGKNFFISLSALSPNKSAFKNGIPSDLSIEIKLIPIGLNNSLLYSFLKVIVFSITPRSFLDFDDDFSELFPSERL